MASVVTWLTRVCACGVHVCVRIELKLNSRSKDKAVAEAESQSKKISSLADSRPHFVVNSIYSTSMSSILAVESSLQIFDRSLQIPWPCMHVTPTCDSNTCPPAPASQKKIGKKKNTPKNSQAAPYTASGVPIMLRALSWQVAVA